MYLNDPDCDFPPEFYIKTHTYCIKFYKNNKIMYNKIDNTNGNVLYIPII